MKNNKKEEAKYVIGEGRYQTADPKSACEMISKLSVSKVKLDIENKEYLLFENGDFAVGAADSIIDREEKKLVFKKMADLLKELVSSGQQIKLVENIL